MENHDTSKKRVTAESFTESSNGVLKNSDITENILSRIPIEFVSQSRGVCKLWRNLLNIPKTGFLFTGSRDSQIRYADEEEVNVSFQSLAKINQYGLGQYKYFRVMYSSCNGLLYFPYYDKEKLVYICNPMTGEYIYLPEMDLGGLLRYEVYGGFGYCISTNEYKVVQVYYERGVKSVGKFQVYTVGGGNGWRYKGEIPFIFSFKKEAVYANNSLYWLEHSTEPQFNNIIAFDLADETFSIHPLPCFDNAPGYYPRKQVHLMSVRGSLGVYHVRTAKSSSKYSSTEMEKNCMDIWTLKRENTKKKNNESKGPLGYSPVYENDDSNTWVWIRKFSMKYECQLGDTVEYHPFAITIRNQILLWGNRSRSSLFCYDPNTLTLKELWDEHKWVWGARAIPHMNSFVSLKDLGESLSKRYVLDDSKLNVCIGDILGRSNGLMKNLNVDITENTLSHIPIECALKTGFLLAVSETERRSEEIQIFHGFSEEVSMHDEPISHKTLTKIDLGLCQSRNNTVKLIRNGPFNPIIFGSCNGLVCLPVRKDERKYLVYICNPMTGEYAYLPEMDFGEISRPKVFGGFGYCQSTNEYKVVQVIFEYNQFEKLGRVQVYTLGDGSGWRNKGEIRHNCQEKLVFANEALYWIERIEGVKSIRAFRLADETFGTLPMPPFYDIIHGYKHSIVSMNGSLCVYHETVERISEDEEDAFNRKEDIRMDIWILKKVQEKKKRNEWYSPVDENDDSNPWVWTREVIMKYKIEFPCGVRYEPISITNTNNQVLMWEVCDMLDFKCKSLVCYDPNTASANALWNKAVFYAQAIPHMNSFVSLENLGEKSSRYIPDVSKFMLTSQKV